jgi:hypothetical protein
MKEKELSVSLGVSREMLKMMRDSYTEGMHWIREESNKPKNLWKVVWTEQGMSMLRKNLGLDITIDPPPPLEEKEGVVSAKFKNPRIMSVLVEGKTLNVLCKDSSKFSMGMDVKIKWDGLRWVVSKHPRFVGKY